MPDRSAKWSSYGCMHIAMADTIASGLDNAARFEALAKRADIIAIKEYALWVEGLSLIHVHA